MLLALKNCTDICPRPQKKYNNVLTLIIIKTAKIITVDKVLLFFLPHVPIAKSARKYALKVMV